MSWNVMISARVFDTVGQEALELLRSSGCRVILSDPFGPHRQDELLRRLEGVDATLCSPDQYNAVVLRSAAAGRLKIISRWGVGYDSIDVAEATRQGIPVAYTPGLLNEAVADWTWALLLGIARRLPQGHAVIAQGQWRNFWGHDVFGKTLGLIGCGRIGRAVARRAEGFDMRVLAFDPAPGTQNSGIEFLPLDEVLAQSDFISLHAVLTPENRGLIGEPQLRRMKRTAYLINTARGALLDEGALAHALTEGWIAGAALDVFSVEPLPVDNPLRQAPNCVLAPHQASFARETADRVSLAAAEAIVTFMQGRKPRWILNPEVFSSPRLRGSLRSES